MTNLARNLLFQKCANLVDFLKKIICSREFLQQSRQTPSDFSRNRTLPFTSLIIFLCNLLKSSYQPELNKFFKIISGSAVAEKVVSKAALCKARKKIKHEAFSLLNQHAVGHFIEHFQPKTWHGFFLKSIDGSTIKLPNFPDITDHFGVWNPRQGDPVPMARISQMFDPLNRVTTHAIIGPKNKGEREMAASHFEHLTNYDLVLLDRGYPAFWFFKLILSKNAHFCARISIKKWMIIRKFIKSGKREQIVTLNAPITSIAACQAHKLDTLPMQLRLIRVELASGETEVLITSLIDVERYPHSLFSELYHDRWPVEEDYKTIKCRIEIENFSGKSAFSVYQDFHSRVFSKNITAMLAFAAQEKVEQATAGRKHSYKINFTQALSTMRDSMVLLFQRTRTIVHTIIIDLLITFASAIEPVRPGRKYPRNHKRSQRKYCLNYKPIL
ncbi:MAG: IS4 family transposase [Gammaproteobacteria bacterium]|nr:IS4 family transposase [Gammaproteobacteria bacterium]